MKTWDLKITMALENQLINGDSSYRLTSIYDRQLYKTIMVLNIKE